MKKSKKSVLAFGKILDTVKYRLKFAHFPYLAEAVLKERARSSSGLLILDVGCGPGNLAAFCGTPAESKWLGLDLWEHQLRQAREKGVYSHLSQVNLLDGLPFRDECLDLVICNEVLLYLPNSGDMVSEFHRVLRPGGKVFIYNAISWFPRVMYALKRLIRKIHQEDSSVAFDTQSDWKGTRRPCRIKYYSLRSLINQIGSAHFRVEEVTGFRLFRNRLRFMTRLEDYAWYYRLTRFLAGRYPYLAADVMVAGSKEEAEPGEAKRLKERSAA